MAPESSVTAPQFGQNQFAPGSVPISFAKCNSKMHYHACQPKTNSAERYCSAQLVFGWSFYRQGSSGEISSPDKNSIFSFYRQGGNGGTSSADEFLDATVARR
jgi:hypothetical protein